MPEVTPHVSIIIPAYNAGAFLQETINSVKAQDFTDWEMIVVNDGSKDNTAGIVLQQNDQRISLLDQVNKGVSTARNNGLAIAKGKYVVFLDADDLMGESFLTARIESLDKDETKGFCCGWVETFPDISPLMKGAAADPEKEILFFEPGVTTVPSNYMLRKTILNKYGINFNQILSSSADRFFLLQVAKHTNGILISSERGRLLYRISSHSMSHDMKPGLIFDNLQMYREVRRSGLLPREKNKFKSQFFFSLALGFALTKKYNYAMLYLLRSAISHPAVFFKLLWKKITTKK
ncbi:MAG: hypothetical protein DI535_10635 [Citrobacter freundii]|nr:MAG: hypothetical protein DI535_10635 [Citrobacter freundii]